MCEIISMPTESEIVNQSKAKFCIHVHHLNNTS